MTNWTTKHDMLRHLSRLAVQLRFADCLYLCGHGGLDYYLDHHLIRPIDQIFTVVRHPLEIRFRRSTTFSPVSRRMPRRARLGRIPWDGWS